VQISLIHVMGAVLTIGIRLTGVMMFAPFFGSVAIPARVKAMFVLAMTALLYPMVSAQIPELTISQWPMVIFVELMIGAGVGVVMNLVFDGVQMAGQVLSVQMGYSLVNIMDPQTQVESTVVAMFHQSIAMLIFLRLNVHFWILKALVHSFDYLPVTTGHISASFTTYVLRAGASVFATGIQIAAPVLAATIVADVALGLMGKASPQLPLMVLGPAIKSILGLVVLISALKFWPDMFERLFANSVTQTERLLHLAL
jgi:flagellar biosynthesis protein FliR